MPVPVQLYVYDLSNGMARQMSAQLTGRQIDGIWHTSIVVFGHEIFYGQGISLTQPGKSHHGAPLRIVDMGETSVDERAFTEYLSGLRNTYTADKYHLLDFNCNSFTNDCIGFLTGGSIPDYIKDLPSDFLSTPFGAALRPTIDRMFRGPGPSGISTPPPDMSAAASPNPALAASLLQAVAARAAASSPGASTPQGYLPTPAPTSPSTPLPATSSLTGQLHVSTNPASFHSLLRTHRAVIAFFTSATCGPCRMIAPVFEELAKTKSRSEGGVAFTKIDLSVGMGHAVASEWDVQVTPTFIFYIDGKKTHEMKGVNAPELRTQIDLLLYEAFPPHPHTRLSLPAIESISLKPILFTQVPALDTAISKLVGFIDGASSWTGSLAKAETKQVLLQAVLPYFKARFATPPRTVKAPLDRWTAVTSVLTSNLSTSELFPLVDLWRLALLDETASAWCTTADTSSSPINIILTKVSTTANTAPRNYILTSLRMLSNAFQSPILARRLLLTARDNITSFLVTSLLHDDASVRTAAASLSFNIAAMLQKRRSEHIGASRSDGEEVQEDADWEVELTSAIIEAIEREKSNEEIVHRLSACLALLLRLSPYTESQLTPLLEVLQARNILEGKLEKGGCGEAGVVKKEVRKLIQEIAEKLCP
ncbi:PPPDE putative peptidase domain-containing protein [Hygrophoropsis aurantiaca]|uniref:PPPDE putative peptidase domain-containing protein n=1 Tax=Hygrophoropsis aurantiaca TaxID=72124 RepID=A0ACB8AKK3_9AGAM|nr:PPPDE putative peptidase domain-containing protein [Hygrophoropsis aurantiaca]